MMKILHKSLTIAILAASIFIPGLNVSPSVLAEKPPSIHLTPEEQAWLKAHPDIKFGFTDAFEPFLIKGDNGRNSGVLVDLLGLLNQRLRTQFELEIDPWPTMLERTKAKELEGVMAIARETADAHGLLQTETIFSVYPVFYIRGDAPFSIKKLDDIRGRSVAILKSAQVMENILEPYKDDISIVRLSSNLECLQMLFDGKVDIAFGLTTLNHFIAKYKLTGINAAYTMRDRQAEVVMGVRSDLPELVNILNKGVASFSQREIDAIALKWLLMNPEASSIDSLFTAEEQAWLTENHTVRVRIVDWPPYSIVKGNEPPQGIVIEYLKLIGERTGIKLKNEVTDQPFAEFLASMKQRQGPDMTAVIVPTPERKQYLSFTEPYISSPYVIFIREQDKPILDISGLTGKTIAVPRGFFVQEKLDKDYPEIKLALFHSDEEALKAVATGQADAYIGNLTVASHIIHRRGLSGLQVAAAGPFKEQTLSMGIRNDWPELTSIFDKALASITEEEKTAIRDKYLAIKFEQGINKADVLKWVFIVGGSTFGIILVFVFWNRRLSREILKRKQTEEHLKQARNEADAANQAKSFFLANMSHDLRTPLNAIIGFTGMLAREQNATADQQEKLAIINRSGHHLLSMIDDVLDLSKIEAGSVELQEEIFDLMALIEEISVMVQSRALEKELFIAMETESVSFPYVKADVGKLRQILINLVSNAVKFTDKGGVTLRCATEPIPDEPKRCHIVIEVADTGPGIDPGKHAEIFEPFVQSSGLPKRKGTGLGLSICKKYVDFMGGSLKVESEVGKGSRFRLQLPAEIAGATDVKTPIPDKAPVQGLAPGQPAWRVLIVEDNRENRLLLVSLLRKAGFEVREAENGEEAVDLYEQWQPHFIWMDMRMPVMDGYEATAKIRSLTGGDTVKITAVTASAFKEQRNDVMAAGCNDMVIKPIQEQEIFEVMARQLGVKYVYEEESEGATRKESVKLTAEMLADLPEELLQELRVTTLALNIEAIQAVNDRIEAHAPGTAEQLRVLVKNFQIDRIRELLEEGKREKMD